MKEPCLSKNSTVHVPAHASRAHAPTPSPRDCAMKQDDRLVVQGEEAASEWTNTGSNAVLLVPQAVGHWALTGVASLSQGY